jgi:hypothetical protein
LSLSGSGAKSCKQKPIHRHQRSAAHKGAMAKR